MITAAEKSFRRRRSAVLLLLALGISVGAVVYSTPALLSAGLSRWMAGQGLSIQLEGLSLGRVLEVGGIRVSVADRPEPFLEASGIRIEPSWTGMAQGQWRRLDRVTADSLVFRWDEHLSGWLSARPPSTGHADWRVGRLAVSNWTASVLGWTANGKVEIEDLTPAGVNAATASATFGTGIAGTLTTDSGQLIIRATGNELPVLLRSVSGIEEAGAEWTLDAGARLHPRTASAAMLNAMPGRNATPFPSLFDALLLHEVWARVSIRAERGTSGQIAIQAVPESGCINLDARVGKALFVEAATSYERDTLKTTLSYRAHPRGEASLTGILDLVVLPRDNFRVLPGSSWTLKRSSLSGNVLPEGTIAFSGDHTRGYALASEGRLGSWSMTIIPQRSAATWKGVLNLRQIGTLKEIRFAGDATLQAAAGSIDWNARGTLTGRAEAGATPVRFEVRAEAHGANERIRVNIPFLRVEDARSPDALALSLTNLKATGSSADWRTEQEVIGRIILRGREFPLALEARGGAEHAEVAPLTVSGIAIRARAAYPGGRYRETVVTIEETSLSTLIAFLPPAQRTIAERSTLAGSIRAAFTHTSDRRLAGSLRLNIAKFHDPVSKVVVEGLEAEIPIHQRFVDPNEVQFITQAERWPEVPVNVRVGLLGQDNIQVRDVTGRAVFADYVFRFRDITFGVLGGRARSRFILDPFRSREGRWRAALELKIEDVPLKNLYEAFVGKGAASRGLDGAIGLELETAWSDTECLEGRGSVRATGPGKVGRRVLEALVQMMEKEKRPPAVAMMLIGDYQFDAFQIDLVRDPSIGDFRANLLLTADDEPFLGEVKLEAPLLKFISGLPIEVEHDIRLRRGR